MKTVDELVEEILGKFYIGMGSVIGFNPEGKQAIHARWAVNSREQLGAYLKQTIVSQMNIAITDATKSMALASNDATEEFSKKIAKSTRIRNLLKENRCPLCGKKLPRSLKK